MDATVPAHHTVLEQKTSFYLQKIEQIDRLLEGPIKTLLMQAKALESTPEKVFPAFISERDGMPQYPSRTTTALCVATLQRLTRIRRRFHWLEKDGGMLDTVTKTFIRWYTTPGSDLNSWIEKLRSAVFGSLNPLTASYVIRVLLEAGEAEVHSELGFLALFAIIWPLYRRYPDCLNAGARIEPWEPTAYTTANCLLPLRKVLSIASRRARLLRKTRTNLHTLSSLVNQTDMLSRWKFNRELEALSANLLRLSKYIVAASDIANLADFVRDTSTALDIIRADSATLQNVLDKILDKLTPQIQRTIQTSHENVFRASRVLVSLKTSLDKWLTSTWQNAINHKPPKAPGTGDLNPYTRLSYEAAISSYNDVNEKAGAAEANLKKAEAAGEGTMTLDLKSSQKYEHDGEYWKDSYEAAQMGFILCDKLLALLDGPYTRTKWDGHNENALAKITMALSHLAEANDHVIELIKRERLLDDGARWCRTIMDREIANAAAGSHTEFDPSELVNGIAVSVKWGLISTKLQVTDAISKAVLGTREDGSWRLGLPFYSSDNAQGIWPLTSDSVWTLVGALKQFPDVDIADTSLFLYVDWLDRTQKNIVLRRGHEEADELRSGWPSDRLRNSEGIHLVTTAFSINALLEIRDLVEFRLWQLCEKRFTTADYKKGLATIDPVDLGATHEWRTHHILARMIADTQGPSYSSAKYSLILHGPPGSSKTKLAEVLAAEMWKESPKWGGDKSRFIRITPADFTRLGEDRLDSEARVIFELLTHVRGVTICFDEIDDLLRRRNAKKTREPSFMALVVPAMLNRLADLRAACPRQEICFLFATNFIENIEPALIRPGRVDRSIPIVYPDDESRRSILEGYLGKLVDRERIQELAEAERFCHVAKVAIPILVGYRHREKIITETRGLPWLVIDKALDEILSVDLLRNPEIVYTDLSQEERKGKIDAITKSLAETEIFKKEKWTTANEIADVVEKSSLIKGVVGGNGLPAFVKDILKKNKAFSPPQKYPGRFKSNSSLELRYEILDYYLAHSLDAGKDKLAKEFSASKVDQKHIDDLLKDLKERAEEQGRVHAHRAAKVVDEIR